MNNVDNLLRNEYVTAIKFELSEDEYSKNVLISPIMESTKIVIDKK
jgi:hypothetical protein